MRKDSTRQYLTLLAILLTIVFNGLANALPLNGQTTGEISDRFQVYFVPAGYVFSIWGLIYLGLLAFGGYQALPAQGANPRLQRIGHLFILSCLANAAWLFLWHYEHFILTVVVMLILLFLLIVIYLRLQIGEAQVARIEQWCVNVPFSIYLGWITVATIANITSLLDYLQWDGWGISPEVWTIIMLAVGAGIAAAMSLTRGDGAYLLVILWAYAGIAVKNAGVPIVGSAAWIATAVIGLTVIVGIVISRRSKTLLKPIG